MSEGNIEFIKAISWLVGINVLINILPSPWGLITLSGFLIYWLWQTYNQTRY